MVGLGDRDSGEIVNPLKAIRAKCLDCCGESAREVSLCTVKGCPLYDFREGANPYRAARSLSEEHKAALAAGRIARAGKGQPGQSHSIRDGAGE